MASQAALTRVLALAALLTLSFIAIPESSAPAGSAPSSNEHAQDLSIPDEFHWDNGPLQVSANRRYLEHSNGQPFLWFGDTVWSMPHRMTLEDADRYFSNRNLKGMTVVQAAVTGVGGFGDVVTDSSANLVNGEIPFLNQDPTQPNEAYFAHLDALIDIAAQHNIYIGLLPTWGGYVCPFDQRYLTPLFNVATARTYGEWIGARYGDAPNLIWIIGGDRLGDQCGAGDLEIWRAMAAGIKSTDQNHLMTYHPRGQSGSYQWFHDDPWLDFNMIQSHKDAAYIYTGISEAYSKTPTKPILQGEPGYEGAGWFSDRIYRSQPYWTFLAGGAGYTYGHRYIYPFDKGDVFGEFWSEHLDDPVLGWTVNWKDLMRSLDWWKLVPDQTIISFAKRGDERKNKGTNRTVAARSSDGDLIVVYYASGNSTTIDLSRVTAATQADARWWNPADKSEVYIGTVPTSGTQSFTPPPGWEDAVLLVSSVPPIDTTPPSRTNGSPSGTLPFGTTSTTLSLDTTESAICRYSTTPNVDFDSMTGTFGESFSLEHATTIDGLVNGNSYAYYVRCQDQSDNVNQDDYLIGFSVEAEPDVTPPVISGIEAQNITDTQASIVWNTDEPADSQVEYGLDTSYGRFSVLDTSLVTEHRIDLTGLTDDTLYHYRVHSKDGSGNLATSDDATFVTKVTPPAVENGPFEGEYYESRGKDKFRSLLLTRTDDLIAFVWSGSPATGVPADNFAVRWRGTFNFPLTSDYAFTAETDDGMRVWIDDVLVLDEWSRQSPGTYEFRRHIAQGEHTIRVEFFEKVQNAIARFSWAIAP